MLVGPEFFPFFSEPNKVWKEIEISASVFVFFKNFQTKTKEIREMMHKIASLGKTGGGGDGLGATAPTQTKDEQTMDFRY